MGDESIVDRNDPALKYLTVEKSQFNDPTTQAEWSQKRLVWVPHESQVRNPKSGNYRNIYVFVVFYCSPSPPRYGERRKSMKRRR